MAVFGIGTILFDAHALGPGAQPRLLQPPKLMLADLFPSIARAGIRQFSSVFCESAGGGASALRPFTGKHSGPIAGAKTTAMP